MTKGLGNQYANEQRLLYIIRWIMGLIIFVACILLVLDYGFYLSARSQQYVEYGYLVLGIFYLSGSILQLIIRSDRLLYFRENKAKYLFGLLLLSEMLTVYLLQINLNDVWGLTWMRFLTSQDIQIVLFQIYLFSNFIRWVVKISQHFTQYTSSPAHIIVVSFGSVIVIGAALLLLPKAANPRFTLTKKILKDLKSTEIPEAIVKNLTPLTDQEFTNQTAFLNAIEDQPGSEPAAEFIEQLLKHAEKRLHPIDALFTATSAVCVTGLIVVDTATAFTRLGQLIILGLIQIGGLGIMTVTAFFTLIVGQRMSGREQVLLGDMLDTQRLAQLGALLRNIFLMTIGIEAYGAALLYLSWGDYFTPKRRLYTALFHSISAFCNAGFSTFSENLMRFATHPQINMVICGLIILGGLGFGTLYNLRNFLPLKNKRAPVVPKFSVQSKLILIMTGSLILAGTLLFFILEYSNTLKGFAWHDKILGAFFQSVTFRTAGFNTIDFGAAHESTLLLGIVWMFIGAAPGSTAGGIKVTTLAILLGAVISAAQGRTRLEVFRRTIPTAVLYQTLVVITMYLTVMMVVSFSLSLTESQFRPVELLFETVSALGTSGLSTGVTSQLSTFGRLLIIITMFVGRIGPFTLALAIGQRQRQRSERYRYPSAKVQIG